MLLKFYTFIHNTHLYIMLLKFCHLKLSQKILGFFHLAACHTITYSNIKCLRNFPSVSCISFPEVLLTPSKFIDLLWFLKSIV